MPKFSVIVPTFRRPQMLAEALESIRSQTCEDFECIVVDDASGESVAIPDDPRFTLRVRETGGSQAGALNTGVEAASGEWLAFLDDDDVFEPRRLEMTLPHTQKADIILVWGKILGSPSAPAGRLLDGNVADTILDHTTPQLGKVTVRRSRMLPFNETYPASADLEWWLRMAPERSVVTVPEGGHQFRVHHTKRVRNSKGNRVRSSFRLIQENVEYFRSHPKALAFRYRRAAAAASNSGDHRLARRLLRRSFRVQPDARVLLQLLRATRRTTNRLGLAPPTL